jgi:type IV pilus assembly protein PilA
MKDSARALADDRGFSLIELLVVILIIGILAAIAIPLFLGQKGKAVDAAAKEMARTGSQAAETYSTDHAGEYKGIEVSVLREYEPAIRASAGSNNDAYLSLAEGTEGGKGYKVTAKAPNGDTFSYTKDQNGVVSRTCATAVATAVSGCVNGSW